ncbi:hypothetical protein [Paraburkholderia youngii]|uniref:hypothetical protein n=1 Tax=Paraburkholderia youngii TaxID=2782701 RepID=UPI003D235DF5
MKKAMRFRSKKWQSALAVKGDRHSEFARRARFYARPVQIAYQRIMSAFGGEPIGVELKHRSCDAWAFVLPDAAGDKAWRIQYFDQDGFGTHTPKDEIADAVEEIIANGYRVLDLGALDREAGTKRWVRGMHRVALMQKHHDGEITWAEVVAADGAYAGAA